MSAASERLLAIAGAYRDRNDCAERGVVLIWRGQAYGWKDRLRNPEHERPGARAVDPEGRVFKAIGSCDRLGAHAWLEVAA